MQFIIMNVVTSFDNMKYSQTIIIKEEIAKSNFGVIKLDKGILKFEPIKLNNIYKLGIMFRELDVKFGSINDLKYER